MSQQNKVHKAPQQEGCLWNVTGYSETVIVEGEFYGIADSRICGV